ncbi:MAG: hypothetical protein ABSC05_24935 [Candidatus Solibacter sp.]|jgi:hypothetical protein
MTGRNDRVNGRRAREQGGRAGMADAATILKMIETVDPSDTEEMDKIDLAVVDYVDGQWHGRQFTRSRDALKEIRPKGWNFAMLPLSDFTFLCQASHGDPNRTDGPESDHLRTEELAELHAIIQAVAYERKQSEMAMRAGKEGQR